MIRSVLPIVLLLAACAQVPIAGLDAQGRGHSLGPATGPAQNCISLPASEGLTVLGDGAIGYRSGATLWVNHMPAQCRLSPLGTVIIERHGSQVCQGDRIRTMETGLTIPGPSCILGPFVPHAAR